MAKRKKRRSLAGFLVSGLFSLVDLLCEGTAQLCMALLRGLWALVRLCAAGLWRLFALLLGALALPFMWFLRRMTGKHLHAGQCLKLTGMEFEAYVAQLLADLHYRRIEMTCGSGDQGVDILCERNGRTYAIQCKNYENVVGNFAVQEAYAGAQFYGCDEAVVVCPCAFTESAVELAEGTGVTLWDGEILTRMMRKSGRKPRHRRGNP